MAKDEYLSDAVKFTDAITVAAGAAAFTAINGATLDMSGFRGLAILVKTGPVAATAVTSFKIQQSDASDMSAPDDLTGSNQAITAVTHDNKQFIFDGLRPQRRYCRIVVSRATANATLTATYLQYNSDNKPVTQSAGVTVEQSKDAIAGTA